jgi:2'-5' RNA ligase
VTLEDDLIASGWPEDEAAWMQDIEDRGPDAAGCVPDGYARPLTAGAILAAAVPGPPQVDSATGEPHTGAMVALVPARPEAWTLRDGEPATALHLTLGYLGESDLIPLPALATIQAGLDQLAAGTAPIDGRVFGASVWNTTGDMPSLNLAVGTPGDGLERLRESVWTLIGRAGVAGGPTALWSPPENHHPWVAHVCVMYGDHEFGLEPFYAAVSAATQLEGDITFDRIRLAYGGQAYDFPLAGNVPAPAPDGSMSTTAANLADATEETTMPTAAPAPRPAPAPTDECPEGQELVDGECVPIEAEPTAAVRPPAEPGEHAWAAMHTQGSSTGDRETGRKFTNTSYRQTPFAFHRSVTSSAHGGTPTVVHVGNVVRVVPGGPGQPDYGFVKLDLDLPEGADYARRLVQGHERWVSIGLDETKPTVTAEWPSPDDEDEDGDPLAMLFEEPDLLTIDGGRVAELTGVSVPAQADAEIYATDELIAHILGADAEPEEEPVTASAARPVRVVAEPEPDGHALADTVQALTAAAYTITIPDLPPSWWFQEPGDVDLSEGAFNLTEEGRIYGAVAPLGVNHRAYARAGRRQEAPTARVDYSRFMGGWALTAAGKVHAGPVTMDCGHASRFRADGDVAPAHYENSCTVVAKIAVGTSRDRGVVWAAGALEPGVTVDQVSRMLACRLSGDWQPHSDKPGWTDFVAALLVPSPGFPMAHGAQVTFEGDALVASSVPVRAVGAAGRPRLRVNLTAGRVERVATATPAEQQRAIVAAVRRGDPVPGKPRRRGCC